MALSRTTSSLILPEHFADDLRVVPDAFRAGHRFNKYSQICARALRQSLKETERVAAEKRGTTILRYQKWENGQGGQQVRTRSILISSLHNYRHTHPSGCCNLLALEEPLYTHARCAGDFYCSISQFGSTSLLRACAVHSGRAFAMSSSRAAMVIWLQCYNLYLNFTPSARIT